jgi:16S rRNA (cytosine967-C5)-methyltransferase
VAEKPKARDVALQVILRVEEGAYADRALNAALEQVQLESRDVRLVTELVNGVFRMRGHLDWVLNCFVKGNVEKLTPVTRNALRLGAYQILFLDHIPDAVAVHETVELAKSIEHQRAANFLNAVLRRVVGREFTYPDSVSDPITSLSIYYSHPKWLVKRWVAQFGIKDTEQLCRANNRVPDVTLRVNALKISLPEAMSYLMEIGVEPRFGSVLEGYVHIRKGRDVLKSEGFEKGWFVAQDESAGLATLLLDPRPGERILDLCSAPGGKTTHLAQRMGNAGKIIAVDINAGRLRLVQENCNRLGIRIVEPVVGDGTIYDDEPFDRILVDAPCSGTGVLARRVDARWRKTAKQIRELAEVQLTLLDRAVHLLKSDGILVYSTCSLEEEENENVLHAVLQKYTDLVVERATPFVPREVVGSAGCIRTFPHRHGVDGSFAVRLKKAA